MGKMDSIIKSEISRLAKREVRGAFPALGRELRAIRLGLEKLAKNLSLKGPMPAMGLAPSGAPAELEATPDEVKVARLTPARIRKLRQKLGLSQRELGVLTGVTVGAVGLWEKGKFRPNMQKKAALVALRKLHKREVRKILAEKAEAIRKKKPAPKKKKVARVKKLSRRPRMSAPKKGRQRP